MLLKRRAVIIHLTKLTFVERRLRFLRDAGSCFCRCPFSIYMTRDVHNGGKSRSNPILVYLATGNMICFPNSLHSSLLKG